MQDPSNSYALPGSKSPSLARENAELVMHLRDALHSGLPGTCRLLAEQSGTQRNAAAITLLAQIARPPRRWRERLRYRNPGWREARLAAIDALQNIGSMLAIESLIPALFDPDPIIKRQAADALRSFGSYAVQLLLHALRRHEWTVTDMTLVIELLRDLNDKQAGPTLARVLLGTLPAECNRWVRNIITYPYFAISGFFMLLALLFALRSEGFSGSLLGLLLWLPACLLGGLFAMLPLGFFVFWPINSVIAKDERGQLAETAAAALTHLQDKNSLPSVIEAAFGAKRSIHRAARPVLLSLLPLLGPEDMGLLPPESVRQLMRPLQPFADALSPQPPEIIVAILHALEHIGPGSAAETVERLGKRTPHTQIHIAVKEVLPVLQARREQELASSVLLRASAMPAAAPEQLLRASFPVSDTAPEQLLRPTQQNTH